MNSQQFGLKVSSAIFGLIALAHLIRLVAGLEIHIGTFAVDLWVSTLGLVVTGLLSFWLWRLSVSPTDKPLA